jgi:hypothetical protein
MKKILLSLTVAVLFSFNTVAQTTGFAWTFEATPDIPLVISENFQDWVTNHSNPAGDATSVSARSVPYVDWNKKVAIKAGSGQGKYVTLEMFQCAVSAVGFSQNYWQNLYDGKTNAVNDQVTAPGFLEVSRISNNATKDLKDTLVRPSTGVRDSVISLARDGYIIIKNIKAGCVIQYSFSSVGGTKRGLTLKQKYEGDSVWTNVRNPTSTELNNPANAYATSGAGVRIEDVIGDFEHTVSLMFTINAGQDYRIHDLRIYAVEDGTVWGEDLTGVKTSKSDAFTVIPLSEYIATSTESDISIYSLNGTLVKYSKNTTRLYTTDLQQGVYIIRATNNLGTVTKKYILY